MDGVLYLEDSPIEGASETVRKWREKGKKVIFLTNNSSLSRRMYVKKLSKMGIRADEREIITSAYMTALYLQRRCEETLLYVVGERGLREELKEAGLEMVGEEEAETATHVVVGIDRSFSYDKIAASLSALSRGAKLIATNPDPTYPTGRGLLPGAGAMVAAISKCSGKRPLIVGKPSLRMYEFALRILGMKPGEVVAVGDRVDLDIKPAKKLGMISVLVLSGVSGRDSPIPKEAYFPDYVVDRISDLEVNRWKR